MSNALTMLNLAAMSQALCNKLSAKERKQESYQAAQSVESAHIIRLSFRLLSSLVSPLRIAVKKVSTIIALLLVTVCSLGFANKAFAGKGGSANLEDELKTINYINQLNQNNQPPPPPQETPKPPPPPPPT